MQENKWQYSPGTTCRFLLGTKRYAGVSVFSGASVTAVRIILPCRAIHNDEQAGGNLFNQHANELGSVRGSELPAGCSRRGSAKAAL